MTQYSTKSVRALFAAALVCLFARNARADVLNGFELFPIFDQSTSEGSAWEVSAPLAVEMKDQKRFPYCGLFAMATFLEIWGDATRTGYVFPPIDESYLSLGYNRVVGSPGRGTAPTWLGVSTAIFGAIPKGAKLDGSATWPIPNWRKENMKLLPTSVTDPLLTGKYTFGRQKIAFTGPSFLKEIVRIDLRNFIALHTDYEEKTKGQGSPDEEETVDVKLRLGDIETTAKNMQLLAQKIGSETRMGVVAPDVLYKATVAQLSSRHPVYLSINAGLTKDRFRKYGVVADQHLVPIGQGFAGPHAVVAVAHCDKNNSVDRICRRFNRYLDQRAVKECIAIQNSWGPDANEQGFFCIAPDAWKRVAQAILLDKSLLGTKP
jgi:hypothetical protein